MHQLPSSSLVAPKPLLIARSREQRLDALQTISGCLESLTPLKSLSQLDRLADRAGEIVCELDTIEMLKWALDHQDIDIDLAYEFENLSDHAELLDQLCALDSLADDARDFARVLRHLQRLRLELDDVITELEDV